MQEPLYFNGFSPTPLNLPATCSLNSDLALCLFGALFVGAGLDPPLHPSAATGF